MKLRIAQSRGYVIRSYRLHHNTGSYVVMTLGSDGRWFIATNDAMKFNTPHQASVWWRANDVCRTGLEKQFWIEGARGGRYHVSSGERMRS